MYYLRYNIYKKILVVRMLFMSQMKDVHLNSIHFTIVCILTQTMEVNGLKQTS